ncbi:MAG: leucine-rich repeat protein [Clostridiales bacterium]|nr:leucine-rich repeat protein [Clostridiales bacterium]
MKKQLRICMTCLAASTLALSLATGIVLGVGGTGGTKYTVTFDTRGGTEIASYSLKEGGKITRPSVIPTKEMFTFGDWYTDTSYKTKFEFGTEMPAYDITIYAGWIGEGSIKLEYNANGGAFDDGTVKKSESASTGVALTAIEDQPALEGYLFDGWYTEPECTNKFGFGASTDDVTLYAGWAHDPHYAYVTYYGNGELITETPIKKGTAHNVPNLFDNTIEISGWCTDETLKTEYTFGGSISNDISLYTTYYSKGLVINGNTVNKYNGNGTKVIVPSVYNGVEVSVIGKNAFYKTSELNHITEIVLPDTIAEIQAGAFYDCRYLVSINLNDKITAIPENAFWNNERLKSVGDISKLTSIGNAAFLGCKALSSIELPDTLVTVGEYAFTNCSMLSEIVLPSRVNKIGAYTFSGCSALTEIDIRSAALNSIGYHAFEKCYYLKSIIIRSSDCPDFLDENGVQSDREESPFVDCTEAKIYVPAGATGRYESKYSTLDDGWFIEKLEVIGADDE